MHRIRHCLVIAVLTGSSCAADGYANLPDKPRFLGVEMSPTTLQTQEREGLTPHQGVQIQAVFNGTAAEKAGLNPGDVILAINGAPLSSMSDLRNEVSMCNVGDQVTLTVARNGQQFDRQSEVQAWPPNVPFEPIDAAAEQRFREWQEKRLAQAQDEVRRIEREAEELAKQMGLDDKAVPSPEQLDKERLIADAALVLGIPGANPVNGWRLRFRCGRSTDPAITAPPGYAPSTTTEPAWRLGASLITPDADRKTL